MYLFGVVISSNIISKDHQMGKLKIENQDDVILKTSTPTLKFIFKDPIEEKDIKKEDLLLHRINT